MNESVTLFVHFTALADKIDELKQALAALIEPTRAEAGCLAYELNQLSEAQEQFIFYEKWVNTAALDFHLQQGYVLDFKKNMSKLLYEIPRVQLAIPLTNTQQIKEPRVLSF